MDPSVFWLTELRQIVLFIIWYAERFLHSSHLLKFLARQTIALIYRQERESMSSIAPINWVVFYYTNLPAEKESSWTKSNLNKILANKKRHRLRKGTCHCFRASELNECTKSLLLKPVVTCLPRPRRWLLLVPCHEWCCWWWKWQVKAENINSIRRDRGSLANEEEFLQLPEKWRFRCCSFTIMRSSTIEI